MDVLFARPAAAAHVALATPPVLESWEGADHRDQRRLRAYLDEVAALIDAQVASTGEPLALELTVGLPGDPATGGRDLDNYLLPVARRIGAGRLAAVFGGKGQQATSAIAVAVAAVETDPPGAPHLQVCATGSSQSRAWKQQIHDACGGVVSAPSPSGPLALCLRFGVSRRRNWSALWKPAIDALGPLLGIPDAAKPFCPHDDRIVDLALHRTVDDTLGDDVRIDAWWWPVS